MAAYFDEREIRDPKIREADLFGRLPAFVARAMARTSGSLRPNGRCWRCWSGIRRS